MKPIDILSIATIAPHKVSNQEIEEKYNLPKGSIEKKTRILSRYFFNHPQEIDSYLLKAIHQAIEDAKIQIEDIECIICSGATNRMAIPYNASYIHALLNAKETTQTFDINMTCLSFLRAFDISSRMFDSCKNILFVSCDIASIGLDWGDIATAGIFGDGISALVLSNAKRGGILYSDFQTHSKGYDLCQIRGGGWANNPRFVQGDYLPYANFEMKGKELFKIVMQKMPRFLEESLKKAKITLDEISYIVPHQASYGSLTHAVSMLKVPEDKVINIFKEYGNQIASSIPFALHHLFKKEKIASGEKILFVGTSAGVGFGLIIWEKP